MTRPIFCFGFGQTARAVAQAVPADMLTASFRNPSGTKARRGAQQGVQPVAFHAAGEALAAGQVLLISIAPDRQQHWTRTPDPVLAAHLGAIAQARPKKIIYLSSSSVYGDKQGSRAGECSPTRPQDKVSRARLRAEQAWQHVARHYRIPLTILRLAALYGPDANPLRRLKQQRGVRVWQEGQQFSRIHTKDVAQAVLALLQQTPKNLVEWFNLCDDTPAPQSEVIRFAARLLGLPTPPLVPLARANLSPMAASFYTRRKKLLNAKIKQHCGLTWHYPSYREGLRACFTELATSAPSRRNNKARAAALEKR